MTFPVAVSLTQPINADVIYGSSPSRKQRKTKPGTWPPASGIPRRVDSRVSADDGLSDGETVHGAAAVAAEYAIAHDSVL